MGSALLEGKSAVNHRVGIATRFSKHRPLVPSHFPWSGWSSWLESDQVHERPHMRILIAEDDEALGRYLRQGLEAECYEVRVAGDGEQACALAEESVWDAMILDLNLPRLDGISVLRRLRPNMPSMPVLILTQKSQVEDRVECLETGADDYLAKPFSFRELSARIRALLRRSHEPSSTVLKIADLRLDRMNRQVERGGRQIDLTVKEFALLEYLMRNTGRPQSRSMILDQVWHMGFDTTTNVVDVYVNYSSAQVDQRKMGKLAWAIQIAFQQMGVFPDGPSHVPPIPSALPFESGPSLLLPPDSAPHNPAPSDASSNEPDLAILQGQLTQELSGEIALRSVAIHREEEGLVLSLREFGFFDSGSVHIKPAALPVLDRIASLLAIRTYRFRIEGHTDNVPIHNSSIASNWELSTARSTELVRLLISRYNFAPDRLAAAGYAEYHPVATNSTVDGRAQNRRVDIVILGSGKDSLSDSATIEPSEQTPPR